MSDPFAALASSFTASPTPPSAFQDLARSFQQQPSDQPDLNQRIADSAKTHHAEVDAKTHCVGNTCTIGANEALRRAGVDVQSLFPGVNTNWGPDLHKAMEGSGYRKVVDPSQVQAGNYVFLNTPEGDSGHVGIADGKGGYYNVSSAAGHQFVAAPLPSSDPSHAFRFQDAFDLSQRGGSQPAALTPAADPMAALAASFGTPQQQAPPEVSPADTGSTGFELPPDVTAPLPSLPATPAAPPPQPLPSAREPLVPREQLEQQLQAGLAERAAQDTTQWPSMGSSMLWPALGLARGMSRQATMTEVGKTLAAAVPGVLPDSVRQSMFSSPQELQQRQATAQNDTLDFLRRVTSGLTAGFSSYLPGMQESGHLTELEGDSWLSWNKAALRFLPDAIGQIGLLAMTAGIGTEAELAAKASRGMQLGMGMELPAGLNAAGVGIGNLSKAAMGQMGFSRELLAWGGISGLSEFNRITSEGLQQGRPWSEIAPEAMAGLGLGTVSGLALTALGGAVHSVGGAVLHQGVEVMQKALGSDYLKSPMQTFMGPLMDKVPQALKDSMVKAINTPQIQPVATALRDTMDSWRTWLDNARIARDKSLMGEAMAGGAQDLRQHTEAQQKTLNAVNNELLPHFEKGKQAADLEVQVQAARPEVRAALALKQTGESTLSGAQIKIDAIEAQKASGIIGEDVANAMIKPLTEQQKAAQKLLGDKRLQELGSNYKVTPYGEYVQSVKAQQKAESQLQEIQQSFWVMEKDSISKGITGANAILNEVLPAAASRLQDPTFDPRAGDIIEPPVLANMAGRLDQHQQSAVATFADALNRMAASGAPASPTFDLTAKAALRQAYEPTAGVNFSDFLDRTGKPYSDLRQQFLRSGYEVSSLRSKPATPDVLDAWQSVNAARGDLRDAGQTFQRLSKQESRFQTDFPVAAARAAEATKPNWNWFQGRFVAAGPMVQEMIDQRAAISAQEVALAPSAELLARVAQFLTNNTPADSAALRSYSDSLSAAVANTSREKENLQRSLQGIISPGNVWQNLSSIGGTVKRLLMNRSNYTYTLMQMSKVSDEFGALIDKAVGEVPVPLVPKSGGALQTRQQFRDQLNSMFVEAIEEPMLLRQKGVNLQDPKVLANTKMGQLSQMSPSMAQAFSLYAQATLASERFGLAAPEMAGFHIQDYILHKYPNMAAYTRIVAGGDVSAVGRMLQSFTSEKQRSIPDLATARQMYADTASRLAAGSVAPEAFLTANIADRARLLGHSDVPAGQPGIQYLSRPENAKTLEDVNGATTGLLLGKAVEDPSKLMFFHAQAQVKANASRDFLRFLAMVEDPHTQLPLLTTGRDAERQGIPFSPDYGPGANPTSFAMRRRTGTGALSSTTVPGAPVQQAFVRLAEIPAFAHMNLDGVGSRDLWVHPEAARELMALTGPGTGGRGPLDKAMGFMRDSILLNGSPIPHLNTIWSGILAGLGGNIAGAIGSFSSGPALEQAMPEMFMRLAQAGWNPKLQTQMHHAILMDYRNAGGDGLTQALTQGFEGGPFQRLMARASDWAGNAANSDTIKGKMAGVVGDMTSLLAKSGAWDEKAPYGPNAWLHEAMLFKPAEYASATAGMMHTMRYLETPDAKALIAGGMSPDLVLQKATEAGMAYTNMHMGTLPLLQFSDTARQAVYKSMLTPGLALARGDLLAGIVDPLLERIGLQSRFAHLPPEFQNAVRGDYRRFFAATTIGAWTFMQTLSYLLNGRSTLTNPPGKENSVHLGGDAAGNAMYMNSPLFGFSRAFVRSVGGVSVENQLQPLLSGMESQLAPVWRDVISQARGVDGIGQPLPVRPEGWLGQMMDRAAYTIKDTTAWNDVLHAADANAVPGDPKHAHPLNVDPAGWMADRLGWATGAYVTMNNVPGREAHQVEQLKTQYRRPIVQAISDSLQQARMYQTAGDTMTAQTYFDKAQQIATDPPDKFTVPGGTMLRQLAPDWDGRFVLGPKAFMLMVRASESQGMQAVHGVGKEFQQGLAEQISGNAATWGENYETNAAQRDWFGRLLQRRRQ